MAPVAPTSDDLTTRLLDRPESLLLALDFDGVLAPIVADPAASRMTPAARAALRRLGPVLGTVAIVTGRPVRTAVELGALDELGIDLVVLGQYGVERWDSTTRTFDIPPAPPAVAEAEAELPAVLAAAGAAEAFIEHKSRALGVHTRQLPDPDAAHAALTEPLRALAERHGLHLEPGKQVLELRPPGTTKGDAIRGLMTERAATGVMYAGDDLGDLPAYDALDALRAAGTDVLKVCAASPEQQALVPRADLVLDGAHGVAAWLTALADRVATDGR